MQLVWQDHSSGKEALLHCRTLELWVCCDIMLYSTFLRYLSVWYLWGKLVFVSVIWLISMGYYRFLRDFTIEELEILVYIWHDAEPIPHCVHQALSTQLQADGSFPVLRTTSPGGAARRSATIGPVCGLERKIVAVQDTSTSALSIIYE